ncbi:unnamed protein product [Brachionus calyciflorus]|uniref:USP domain-containing protein n=1 Tax=Brachionus calyciflorus TaxID=104777 RepID=A0A814EWS9_9BILA|nr:unnamed protein product [Brachionus calyciflorus]
MNDISEIAANRYLKKINSNAFYCSTSLLKAYESFKYQSSLSFSSFYKYVSEKYKKPHRFSDLCDYCEKNKEYKKELQNYASENFYEGENEYQKIKEYLIGIKSGHDLVHILNLGSKIESIDFHYSIAQRQRDSYNSMRNELEEDYILIDMDWKQKITIGVYYKENGVVKCENFYLISGFQNSESAQEVVNNFRFVRKLPEFKRIEKKKYIIWADTGTHFRCSEVLHYLFEELFVENIQVCLNFFVEKHGKSSRDQHFSVVSNFIRQESFLKKITCSQDIVDAINKNQDISNNHRKRLKLDQIITHAFVVDPNMKVSDYKQIRMIKNIRNYYNFFKNSEGELRSVILSDLRTSKIVEYRNKMHTLEEPIEISNDDEKKCKEQKLSNIRKKMKSIKKNIRLASTSKQSNINSTQEISFYLRNSHQIEFDTDCFENCENCNSALNYRLSDLAEDKMTRAEVIEELKIHGHPSSKKNKNNKNRTKVEAINELKNHYLRIHRTDINESDSALKFTCNTFRENVLNFDDKIDNPFLFELKNFFSQLQNSSKAANPRKLIETFDIEIEWFNSQQDVNEFYKKFFGKLEKECRNSNLNLNLNHFKWKSIIECKQKNYSSKKMEEFIDISLTIKGKKNIYESLHEYIKPTVLTEENRLKIDDETFIENAVKFYRFERLPEILIINLMRFHFDKKTIRLSKLNDRFEFMESLDLSAFVHDNLLPKYKLFAVIVHKGQISFGHYNIFINMNLNDLWFKFDDDLVRKCNKEEVFTPNFGRNLDDSCAYMLAYINEDYCMQSE